MWYDSKALSFLDPLFVFSAISLRVSSGLSIFLKDFRLDYIRYCAPYRNNSLYLETRDLIWSFSNFLVTFFPRYFTIFLPFFSNAFLFSIGSRQQRYRGNFYNISKFGTVPIQLSPFVHLFSPSPKTFLSIGLIRRGNKKQTFMHFRNGCLRRKWSFFAGRRKTRRASSSGAGI